MSTFNRRAVMGFAIVIPIVASGCWDKNKTFVNNNGINMTVIKMIVDIPGGGASFPEVNEWYNGQAPASITDMGQTIGGARRFELKWNVNVAPGSSAHVGWKFKNSGTAMNEVFGDFSFAAGPNKQAGDLAIRTIQDPQQGLVLQAFNHQDSPGPITVTRIQWTATTAATPLAHLAWGDPVTEALPWQDMPISVPFTLHPGDPPVSFDAPDQALGGKSFGLVRFILSDPSSGIGQETVYQTPFQSIPTLNGLSIAVLCVLLMGIGTIIVLKRGRQSLSSLR